jgi:hypothetical protein
VVCLAVGGGVCFSAMVERYPFSGSLVWRER